MAPASKAAPAGGQVQIAGRKLPPWLLLAGGVGVLVVIYLATRGGGGGGGAASAGQAAAGVLSLGESLAGEREARTEAIGGLRDLLAGQIGELRTDLTAARGEQTAQVGELRAEVAGPGGLIQQAVQSILDQLSGLLDRLTGVEGRLTAGETVLGRLGERVQALETGQTGGYQGAPNLAVPFAEIQAWARGISLPVEWGTRMVAAYGRLPRDIPELERWRSLLGYVDASGRWCISSVCL